MITKYIFRLVIAAALSFIAQSKASPGALDKEFWEAVYQFDQNLHSFEVAKMQLEHLKQVGAGFTSLSPKVAILLREIEFTKRYQSYQQYSEFLNHNLSNLAEKNFNFLGIYSEHIINTNLLLKSKNKIDYDWLKFNKLDGEKSFYMALNLFLTPTIENFTRLENFCNARCNFSIYHQAKMRFFQHKGELEKLKVYCDELFDRLINQNLFVNDYAFPSYLLAYLSHILKLQGELSSATKLLEEATAGVGQNSFVHKMIEEIAGNI